MLTHSILLLQHKNNVEGMSSLGDKVILFFVIGKKNVETKFL